MNKIGLTVVFVMTMVGCGDPEPVATSYKKSMAAAGTTAPATGGTTPTGTGTGGVAPAVDNAALVKQGTDLYAKSCAGCHLALTAPSAKKGRSAAAITAASSIGSHSTVKPYPTAAEASALEAALK